MLPSACNDSVGALIAPFRSSIPSPPIPLFTLRRAPRGTQRKTRGRAVRYSFLVRLFHSLLRAGLSRRSITRPHRSYSPLRLPDWPPPFLATFGAATPSQSRASLTDLRSPSLHAVLNTPVDRIRCSLVGELRVPARVSSLSMQPSPFAWRVGVHIFTFEACSSFTRVTACRVARLPYVSFITRPHPSRLPGSGARKLPSSTNNLLGWVLPPLVICAVEAHTRTPHTRNYDLQRSRRAAARHYRLSFWKHEYRRD